MALDPQPPAHIELTHVALGFAASGAAALPAWIKSWLTSRGVAGEQLISARSSRNMRWALQDVSLRLCAGERVGIVGANGAGKTTLLRVMAGIYLPQRGQVEIRGQITAVLGLNNGVQQDLTGLENLRLGALLVGLNAGEVEQRLPEMIEFSGLGAALGDPVRTYSTGMVARLGFSVAAVSQPEILLLDETLGVGDGAFRRRCAARIEQLTATAQIAVICSHQVTLIERYCERALWLHRGELVADGPASEVLAAYQAFLDAGGVDLASIGMVRAA